MYIKYKNEERVPLGNWSYAAHRTPSGEWKVVFFKGSEHCYSWRMESEEEAHEVVEDIDKVVAKKIGLTEVGILDNPIVGNENTTEPKINTSEIKGKATNPCFEGEHVLPAEVGASKSGDWNQFRRVEGGLSQQNYLKSSEPSYIVRFSYKDSLGHSLSATVFAEKLGSEYKDSYSGRLILSHEDSVILGVWEFYRDLNDTSPLV